LDAGSRRYVFSEADVMLAREAARFKAIASVEATLFARLRHLI
jgi:hypothetical protein